MMEISAEKEQEEKKVISGDFSQEFYMDRDQVADFLRKVANEVEAGNELKISTNDWELPFKFRDKIEVEIDVDYDELEIELEFEKYEGGEGLSVE